MESIKNRYAYKGNDMTAYMIFKIETIASIIANTENIPFDAAYAKFIASKTYGLLHKPEAKMWGENAEFVVDEYYREVGLPV